MRFSTHRSLIPLLLTAASLVAACGGNNGADGLPGAAGANGTNGTNGAAGVNGSNGTNGLNALVSTTVEPAGAHCAYGGSKIQAGNDTNGNTLLDANEVTSTQYVCNPPPTGLAWVDVLGNAVQALPNTGYLANNPSAPVTVTLPANPALGDVVAVSGLGAGGWKIAQNAGQSIYTGHLPGGTISNVWTPRTNGLATSTPWTAIATSYDGLRMVAGAGPSNGISYSSDGGYSWQTSNAPAGNWTAVASSRDGLKMAAVAFNDRIYLSSNGGAAWTAATCALCPPALSWRSIAMSPDGQKLIAGSLNGPLYTSSDGGVSWSPRSYIAATTVAINENGSRLYAQEGGGLSIGNIYVSTDMGASWTVTAFPSYFWASMAISRDGMRIAAITSNGGGVFTSDDGGVTYANRTNPGFGALESIASSSNGSRLVMTSGGPLYVSDDAGASWQAKEASRSWTGVASSYDGLKLVAVANNPFGPGIFTADTTPVFSTTPGTAGGISGVQYDSLELQYNGSGLFTVLSYAGTFLVQ